jgi:hypothetical protein
MKQNNGSISQQKGDYYDVSSEASSCEEFVEEMHNDDLIDFSQQEQCSSSPSPSPSQPPIIETSTQHAQHQRPPPIRTEWEASMDEDENEQDTTIKHSPVTSNLPRDSFNTIEEISEASAQYPSSSMIHFQNPKRYNSDTSGPYPTQSVLMETSTTTVRIRREKLNDTPNPTSLKGSPSLAEVTPAFLRRAAQELGVTHPINSTRMLSSNRKEPVPPNSMMYSRDRPATAAHNHLVNNPIPDSSFFGADASALDGTFVSIRDLTDDDDVPSVDNRRWNSSTTERNADLPTETTSLLKGKKTMAWQGGFFGSQMEKEDLRERRNIMRARKLSFFSEWMWAVRTLLLNGSEKNDTLHDHKNEGSKWKSNHPVGGYFMAHNNSHVSSGRVFSLVLIVTLCLHTALCGSHDLFLRYIAYRNPLDNDEAEASWNGEGEYLPAFWLSFEGRVFNPLVGPGARTLTAFGALVPGLVLAKGQVWRVGTSSFQESSVVQVLLHAWVLKSAIGGPMTGFEWRRGTFVVSCIYLISGLIGSAWSIAVEPGRLITASGMGIAGLLAAAAFERACSPAASKDYDDKADGTIHRNCNDGERNVVSSSSNEQFELPRPKSRKKKHLNRLNNGSPAFLLLLELSLSWWAAYSSLIGTAMAAIAGFACALLLFVGNPPPGNFGRNSIHDLLFNETLPPPPPPPMQFAGGANWRDDDSADTSVEAGREVYTTPLMRKSIMADEEDEEEPSGTRSSLRKRNFNGTSDKTPVVKGRMISLESNDPFSAARVISRVIGALLALLLTLIPASLIATGEGASSEVTRASVLGCIPMRIVYKADENSDFFECAGGCIPLSRERMARNEKMRPGRCDALGYQCLQQSGTMTFRGYSANVGVYVTPSSDGSCGNAVDANDQR